MATASKVVNDIDYWDTSALVFLATSQVVQFAEQIARRAEPH
jgi:hypothetical protein